MKKITLKEAKAVLKKDDYMEALSFFANYLLQFEEEDREDELYDLDERLFDKANDDWNCGEMYLKVYSALMTAI